MEQIGLDPIPKRYFAARKKAGHYSFDNIVKEIDRVNAENVLIKHKLNKGNNEKKRMGTYARTKDLNDEDVLRDTWE